jgi:hypothetical protein
MRASGSRFVHGVANADIFFGIGVVDAGSSYPFKCAVTTLVNMHDNLMWPS